MHVVVVEWLSVRETGADAWAGQKAKSWSKPRLLLTTWDIATNWTYDSSLKSFTVVEEKIVNVVVEENNSELSFPVDWCFNGQQRLPRRKNKSSVAPWSCQQGSAAKFKDTSTVFRLHRDSKSSITTKKELHGRTFLLPFLSCCVLSSCVVVPSNYKKDQNLHGKINFVSIQRKRTIRQKMVQVRNIVSKKGWATTARFHAFKYTQILTIPSNHRAAFLAHVLLKMNIWILLKDPLYGETLTKNVLSLNERFSFKYYQFRFTAKESCLTCMLRPWSRKWLGPDLKGISRSPGCWWSLPSYPKYGWKWCEKSASEWYQFYSLILKIIQKPWQWPDHYWQAICRINQSV